MNKDGFTIGHNLEDKLHRCTMDDFLEEQKHEDKKRVLNILDYNLDGIPIASPIM